MRAHAQSPIETEKFRASMQRLFRRFGVLAGNRTPCGKPLSMAHAHALMVLRRQSEMTQQGLAAELCIDKSNVTRLCTKMVEMGHVSQRHGETDRRSRHVRLTPKGARLADELDLSSMARFGELLDALPSAQRPKVLSALESLIAALGVFSEMEEKVA